MQRREGQACKMLQAVPWKSADEHFWIKCTISKHVHLNQNVIDWPKTISTNALDIYPATENTEARNCHKNGCSIFRSETLDHKGKHDLQRWTKDPKKTKQHLVRVLQNREWSKSVQRDVLLFRNQSVHEGQVAEQTVKVPMPQNVVEIVESRQIVDTPVLPIETSFFFDKKLS